MAGLPASCLRLQRRVADDLARTAALRAGESALLLLSGGADSMALLSLLRAADHRLELGLRFSALHVDYGLRGRQSDRDRVIVERACAAAGLPLHVERLHAGLHGSDFQARAREHRYALARALAREHDHDVVVTAHNRDDQAETVLYRLTKYASPAGLAGMRPRRGDLARPLLDVGAAELREYCRAAAIEYGEDATNAEPVYARNVVRHQVLPRLEELNPRVSETLAAMAELAAAEADVLAAVTREARRRVARRPEPDESAVVDLAALAAEPPAVQALLLHALARDAMGGRALVGRRRVQAMQRLATREADAGRVALGRGLEAVRVDGTLRIRAVPAAHTCVPAEVEGEALVAAADDGVTTAFCGRMWRLRLLSGAVFEWRGAEAGQAFLSLSELPRRVGLRHPAPGERFAPLGLDGETTVARFLAAAHVPIGLRGRAVVVDVDGVTAWVGGPAVSPGRVAQPFRVAHSSTLTLHVVQEGT